VRSVSLAGGALAFRLTWTGGYGAPIHFAIG